MSAPCCWLPGALHIETFFCPRRISQLIIYLPLKNSCKILCALQIKMYGSIAFVRPKPESRIVEFVVCSPIYNIYSALPTPLPFQLQLNEKEPARCGSQKHQRWSECKKQTEEKTKMKNFWIQIGINGQLNVGLSEWFRAHCALVETDVKRRAHTHTLYVIAEEVGCVRVVRVCSSTGTLFTRK